MKHVSLLRCSFHVSTLPSRRSRPVLASDQCLCWLDGRSTQCLAGMPSTTRHQELWRGFVAGPAEGAFGHAGASGHSQMCTLVLAIPRIAMSFPAIHRPSFTQYHWTDEAPCRSVFPLYRFATTSMAVRSPNTVKDVQSWSPASCKH